MGQVAIGVRLDTHLDDLQVAAGTVQVLSARNAAVAKHVQVLHPTSLDDVKNWLGMPQAKPAAGAAIAHRVVHPAESG